MIVIYTYIVVFMGGCLRVANEFQFYILIHMFVNFSTFSMYGLYAGVVGRRIYLWLAADSRSVSAYKFDDFYCFQLACKIMCVCVCYDDMGHTSTLVFVYMCGAVV